MVGGGGWVWDRGFGRGAVVRGGGVVAQVHSDDGQQLQIHSTIVKPALLVEKLRTRGSYNRASSVSE